jgi:lipopolysaccharide/colanic/teichoic acid biosynthesis glycosyltransferase
MSIISVHSGDAIRRMLESGAGQGPWRLWGAGPVDLHDRVWAARGIEIVRPGHLPAWRGEAQAYLLVPDATAMFEFSADGAVRRVKKEGERPLLLEAATHGREHYHEQIDHDERVGVRGIKRHYEAPADSRLRCVLTKDRALADAWQREAAQPGGRDRFWPAMERSVAPGVTIRATMYSAADMDSVKLWLSHAAADAAAIRAAFPGVRELDAGVWAHASAVLPTQARLIGPMFIGAGASVPDKAVLVGPIVVPDDPAADASLTGEIVVRERDEDTKTWPGGSSLPRIYSITKRLFDIGFAAAMLTVTAPLMLVIAIAIMIEDGRPIFFGHKRQTRGGREFRCWKFRTMVRNADQMQAALRAAQQNLADGPQFFMDNDPRILKVGQLLRKTQLDELPQFWNVLLGDMSVVGPRPSPDKENQHCPPWREARLSVRAGVTGLWQVRRKREAHTDFQEWIRYDIEYVQHRSWHLDITIIAETVLQALRIRRRG